MGKGWFAGANWDDLILDPTFRQRRREWRLRTWHGYIFRGMIASW